MSNLFRCILVLVSGSESSIAAGKLAIQIAKQHNSLLILVHVVDTALRDQMARLTGRAPETIQQELEDNGWRYLNYLARLAQSEGVQVKKTLRVGLPLTEIIAEAEASQATLIVAGKPVARGPRGVFQDRIFGRVIDYAPVPILVVKPGAEAEHGHS